MVLGATGTIGRAVSAELARSSEVQGVVVASRSADRAEWVARNLGGPPSGVTALAIDVRDEAAARRAFASSGCDVVVSCAGPAPETEVPGVLAAVRADEGVVGDDDSSPKSFGLGTMRSPRPAPRS